MATLKGQNLRIYTITGSKAKVIGMATNCTITMTGNTELESHKDITDMASSPTITSKSWQVQVDSLNVADMNSMLTAIKSGTKFKLMWEESLPNNNQNLGSANYARVGDAFLTDCTFTFNDRESSTKNLQFMGTGPLDKIGTDYTLEVYSPVAVTKGQYVRLFLSDNNSDSPSKVIGAAKNLSFHVSVATENITTKDTVEDWVIYEATELNYDISSSAFVKSDETVSSSVGAQALDSIEEIYEAALPVKFLIANTSGANNRTKGKTPIVSGSVIVTSLVISGPNRQTASYQTTFTGYGPFAVGS